MDFRRNNNSLPPTDKSVEPVFIEDVISHAVDCAKDAILCFDIIDDRTRHSCRRGGLMEAIAYLQDALQDTENSLDKTNRREKLRRFVLTIF